MALILNKIQAERIMQAVSYLNDLSIIETTIRLLDDNEQAVSVEIYGNCIRVRLGLHTKENYPSQYDFALHYGVD